MFQRYSETIFFILVASGLAFLQISFISAGPEIIRQLNLVLIFLVFTLFFFGWSAALWLALIIGFWLDLLSFNFFGFYLINLSITILLAHYILRDWLTNRSLYSFLLIIIGATIFYNFLSALVLLFTAFDSQTFFLGRSSFWLTLLKQSLGSGLAAILLFHLATAVTKKLRPGFLGNK